jgi:hypothetical protein
VRLEMLAKDEDSGRTGCPSVYIDESGWAVVQGPEVDTNIRSSETGVRIKAKVLVAAVAALGGRLETLPEHEDAGWSVVVDESGWALVTGPEVEADTMASLVNLLPGETGVRIAPRVLAAAVATPGDR